MKRMNLNYYWKHRDEDYKGPPMRGVNRTDPTQVALEGVHGFVGERGESIILVVNP